MVPQFFKSHLEDLKDKGLDCKKLLQVLNNISYIHFVEKYQIAAKQVNQMEQKLFSGNLMEMTIKSGLLKNCDWNLII